MNKSETNLLLELLTIKQAYVHPNQKHKYAAARSMCDSGIINMEEDNPLLANVYRLTFTEGRDLTYRSVG